MNSDIERLIRPIVPAHGWPRVCSLPGSAYISNKTRREKVMSRRTWTNTAAAAGVVLALGAVPALAQQSGTGATTADEKGRAASTTTGEKITDAWILTKVKAQFVGEDALEHSDINVDVRNHIVYLKGTVASQAGKARAAEIARATDGVTSVQNHLRVGVAANGTIHR